MEDASSKTAAEPDKAPSDEKPASDGKAAKPSSPSARLKKQAPKRASTTSAKPKDAASDTAKPAKSKGRKSKAAAQEATSGQRAKEPAATADTKDGSARQKRAASKAKRKTETDSATSAVESDAKPTSKAKPARKPAKAGGLKASAAAALDKAKKLKEDAGRGARLSFKPKQAPIVAAERGIPDDDVEDGRPPVPDLVEVTGNAIPPGCISSVIETPGGLRLRAAMWPLPHGRAKGTVCLFHGRTESIEKYFETVRDLLARGFWVATLDWRGQGGSDRLLDDPLKGHVNGFKGYREDLNLFMHDVVLPDCPPPYFALAHSMGGLVLLQTAGFRGNWFERIVTVAPLVGLPEDNRLSGIAVPTARAMRLAGLGGMAVPIKEFDEIAPFANNPLTSDAERYSRWSDILEADPRLRVGRPTFGWLAAVGDAMDVVNSDQFPSHVQVPVLMVSAGLDRVVSSRAIEVLGKRLRIGGHISVDGARHEILQERDSIRDRFFAAFDTFIPGTPSGV